jgi:hypothetical protein
MLLIVTVKTHLSSSLSYPLILIPVVKLVYLFKYRPVSLNWNWDSSVSIMSDYGLDDWGLIPGRGKEFLLFAVSRSALGPTKPPIQ